MIHKTRYLILKSNKDFDLIEFDNKLFAYFDIIDSDGNILDTHDHITIQDDVQCDIILYEGEWCVRYFPNWMRGKEIQYDDIDHVIGYHISGRLEDRLFNQKLVKDNE